MVGWWIGVGRGLRVWVVVVEVGVVVGGHGLGMVALGWLWLIL